MVKGKLVPVLLF